MIRNSLSRLCSLRFFARFWITLPLLFVFGGLSSCSQKTELTIWQYMPHMANTPILKAMKGYEGFGNGSSMLMPPAHTVARGHRPYHIQSVEEAERTLVNPLRASELAIGRGKQVFDTICITCHGEKGYGDGPIVKPFPVPKSLQSPQMLAWNDGHLFHVITKGQGNMPSYAQQVQPMDRWAAILYLRTLQKAEHPDGKAVADQKPQATQN